MLFKTALTMQLLLFWINYGLTQQQTQIDIPNSPCPQLFQYKFNGNDYFGELQLPSPSIHSGETTLTMVFTVRAVTDVRAKK